MSKAPVFTKKVCVSSVILMLGSKAGTKKSSVSFIPTIRIFAATGSLNPGAQST